MIRVHLQRSTNPNSFSRWSIGIITRPASSKRPTAICSSAGFMVPASAKLTTSRWKARGCAKAIKPGAQGSSWPTHPVIRIRIARCSSIREGRLWLLWPTILANEWHTALMKYRISSDYSQDGPPRWEFSDVLHVTPGQEFVDAVTKMDMASRNRRSSRTVPKRARTGCAICGRMPMTNFTAGSAG